MAAVQDIDEQKELQEEQNPGYIAKATKALGLLRWLGPTVAYTAFSFYAFGPTHPSWPLQTALFTAVVRKASTGRTPRDPNAPPIDTIKAMKKARKELGLEALIGTPKNGFVTQVEVPVKKWGLGGILEEFDAVEDRERKVPAEWTIHKAVYQNIATASSRVVLYLHGGAYTLMSPASHRPLTILMSKAINGRVLSLGYRLAPEAPFPGGLHDAVAAYLYLTRDLGIAPENIIVSGDSAGGGLSMALLLYLRDHELPMPGGAILLSPWTDLTASLKSWEHNASYDYLTLSQDQESPMNPVRLYLGELYATRLTHPYVTSCTADLSSLPPLLIQAGDYEVLRDESTLLALRAAKAGVDVTYEIWDGGVHVLQAFVGTEASRAALGAIQVWVEKQKEAVKVDFSEVDQAFQVAWEALPESLKSVAPSSPSSASRGSKVERPTLFTGDAREPPKLECRVDANEVVRKAVEEVAGDKAPAITTFYVAARAPGLLERVRGTLHL